MACINAPTRASCERSGFAFRMQQCNIAACIIAFAAQLALFTTHAWHQLHAGCERLFNPPYPSASYCNPTRNNNIAHAMQLRIHRCIQRENSTFIACSFVLPVWFSVCVLIPPHHCCGYVESVVENIFKKAQSKCMAMTVRT